MCLRVASEVTLLEIPPCQTPMCGVAYSCSYVLLLPIIEKRKISQTRTNPTMIQTSPTVTPTNPIMILMNPTVTPTNARQQPPTSRSLTARANNRTDSILSKLDIRTVQSPRSWKWTIQHRLKDATESSLKYGVVYELTCNDCDLTCVGDTARNLGKRVSEHRAGVCNDHPEVSAATEHMLSYDHHLDREHPRIIEKDTNTIRRRIKEALAIHTRTTKNRDKGLELSKLRLNRV